MSFLDKTGLEHFWSKCKSAFASKSHTHNEYMTEAQVDAKLEDWGGGGGGGGSSDGKIYLADQQNGTNYVLKVVSGKLTMEEMVESRSVSSSSTVKLTDEVTGTNFALKVVNGKLTMEEVV